MGALRTPSARARWSFYADLFLQYVGGIGWIWHSVCSWIAAFVAIRVAFGKEAHTMLQMVGCQVVVVCFGFGATMGMPSAAKFVSGSLVCPIVFNSVFRCCCGRSDFGTLPA